jgi:hypothetical protein
MSFPARTPPGEDGCDGLLDHLLDDFPPGAAVRRGGARERLTEQAVEAGGDGGPRDRRLAGTHSLAPEALGHSTIVVTADIYSHVMPVATLDAAEPVGTFLRAYPESTAIKTAVKRRGTRGPSGAAQPI